MKMKLLLTALLFAGLSANAQFTVETHAGDAILDGGVYDFNTVEYPDAALSFYVNNESTTEQINMRIEVVSFTNTDGSMMELCFGDCFSGVASAQTYPINAFVTIEPSSTQTSTGDHFFNMDAGDGSSIITYQFRFIQVDSDLNEIGDDLSITYNYDPALGVNDVNKLEVSVYPTVTNSEVNVSLQENATVEVYDLRGRVVLAQALEAGNSKLNLSNLASQAYILKFTNQRGASQTTKVVVR